MAELSIEQQLVVRELMRGIVHGEAARYLLAVAEEQFFPAGTVIHVEGDPAQHIHILLEGKVRMMREGEGDWVFDRGGVIGVLDAERASPHRRSAIAIFDTRTVAVRVDDWHDLVEDNLEMTIERTRRNLDDLVERGLRLPPTAGLRTQIVEPPSLLDEVDGDAADLSTSQRLLVLRLSPIFAQARTQPLLRLAREARVSKLARGDELYDQGDPAEGFHIVVAGRLLVGRDDPAIEVEVRAPNLVGAYSGIVVERHAYRARALEDATVLSVPHDPLFDTMEDHVDLVRSVLTYVANARDDVQRLQRNATGGVLRVDVLPGHPAS